MKALGIVALVFGVVTALSASQVSYSNSGGSVTMTSTTLTITSSTLSVPSGTVSMSCPLTSITAQYPYTAEWSCAGGTVTIQSTDGTTKVNASFVSGIFTLSENSSHGVTSYYYALYANFQGSKTLSGKTTAVIGAVSQTLAVLSTSLDQTTGTIQTGIIDASQQWEPVYIADTGNNRIVQTADILGSNWLTLGKLGSGAKQFSAPWGVALDSAGKIYVSDSGNCRIVRSDNMLGLNWISYGTCGSGTGQFSAPEGLWVDKTTGKIYVADTGNNRIVRMDDMTGTNFVSLGTLGTGTGQFSSPAAITTDPTGNIYVADNGNARIAEFSDMLGTNWAVLQFSLNYFTPAGVAVDSSGRIYATDSLQSQLVRSDNITGANQVWLNVDNYNNFFDISHPTGLSVDSDGAVFVADTANSRTLRYYDMSFTDIFSFGTLGAAAGNLNQPHAVVAVPQAKTLAVSALTPTSIKFPLEIVGTAGSPVSAVLSNIGTAPFTVASVQSTAVDFQLTHNCPSNLKAGASCTASIVFQPTTGGLHTAQAKFTLMGAASKMVSLSGAGALVSVSPTTLVMYEQSTGYVTVTNPLSTSTTLKAIRITTPFAQTNNCATLAPGASCTITVTWSVPPPVTGTLTITDASGISQLVQLVGE